MEHRKQNIRKVVRQLINLFREKEKKTDQQSMDKLWFQIQKRVKSEEAVAKRRKYLVSIAASAAILLGIFWTLTHFKPSSTNDDRIKDIASAIDIDNLNSEDVILIMSEEKQIALKSDSVVTYSKEGVISLKSETIELEPEKEKEVEYNQLIVPNGKRIQLVLPDASKLWVNSGTKVVYPRTFEKNKREIYIDGEVYLDVAHNKNIPFIVKTNDFDVQVLGTSFNICTYKGMESSVVLVNGAVNVQDSNGKKSDLQPNERIVINQNGLGTKKYVNAQNYISWIDNLLILSADPLEEVFNKLSIYYGVAFKVDESAKSLLLSGKLDLKSNIENVVSSISKTAPISYSVNEGEIIIVGKR